MFVLYRICSRPRAEFIRLYEADTRRRKLDLYRPPSPLRSRPHAQIVNGHSVTSRIKCAYLVAEGVPRNPCFGDDPEIAVDMSISHTQRYHT